MGTVNAYENEVDKVNTLEGDVRFLDFEDNNDNIRLLYINIYF